jgi:hypothetical protein
MRLLVAILICLTLRVVAVESSDQRIGLYAFTDNNTANRLLAVARRCELRIDSLLGTIVDPVWLRIYPAAKLPLGDKDLLLGVGDTQHQWQSAPAIARALLHRRMDREIEPLPQPEQVPEWLVAAVAHQVVTERGEFSPLRRFPACRSILAHGEMPDLKTLVDAPVSPESSLFYQLYGEFCSALVLSIRRADREAAGRILQASAAELPPSEIINREMQFIVGGNLQAWWRERFPATVYSIFNPITHEQAIGELQKAQVITVILSDTDEGRNVALAPMDKLLERHRRPQLDPASLDAAHIKLFNLLQHAPVSLREPINAYLGALNALRDDSRFTFSRRIRAAARSLAASRDRGPLIQNALRELDHRKTYHGLLAYHRFFGRTAPTAYSRELRDYLDRLERGPR